MVLVEHEFSIITSSNPANGATGINADENKFTVILNDPIAVPATAINCTIELNSASVWYVQPNISEELKNNDLSFTHLATPYQFTIPDGLYSLSDLNAWLSREFLNATLPEDLFVIIGIDATQKTVITFTYAGTQLDFTPANSVAPILGFDAGIYPAAPSVAGESVNSQDTASFNAITNYLISCSLAPDGIPINDIGSNIVATVPITTSPGNLITYQPFNPLKASADNLIGSPINVIDMKITDQNDKDIEMLGEYWNAVLVIRYYLQVNDSRPVRSEYKNAKHESAY